MLLDPAGIRDHSALPERYTREQWESAIHDMRDGHVLKIPEWFADYFRDVLPPMAMFRGGFLFCEGEDFPTLFFKFDSQWFALRTRSSTPPDWSAKSTAQTSAERLEDMKAAWKTEYRTTMIRQILDQMKSEREATVQQGLN